MRLRKSFVVFAIDFRNLVLYNLFIKHDNGELESAKKSKKVEKEEPKKKGRKAKKEEPVEEADEDEWDEEGMREALFGFIFPAFVNDDEKEPF